MDTVVATIGKLFSLIKVVIRRKIEKNSFFGNRLNAFVPHGLNERLVGLEWI